MIDFPPDRRGTILEAAMQVFTAYGFRKTSMDDIAKQAGMSRPALYQEFRNKTDIFRGLSQTLLELTMAQVDEALRGPGPFRQRFMKAVDVGFLELHRVLLLSPHGQELVGINDEIAADIDALWKQRFAESFASGFSRAAKSGDLDTRGFSPGELARIFMLAVEGLKAEFHQGKTIERDVYLLVDILMGAPSQETENHGAATAVA